MRLPEWMYAPEAGGIADGPVRGGVIDDRNAAAISAFARDVLTPGAPVGGGGLFARLGAGARVAGVFVLVLAGAFMDGPAPLLGLLALAVSLAMLSRVSPAALFKKAGVPVVFTVIVTLPVFFGFFIPHGGVLTGMMLVARVAAMASLVSLALLTTGQNELLGALRAMPLPRFFVTALFLAYRCVFSLLKKAEDAVLSRKSRTIEPARLAGAQRWFASRAAFLFVASLEFSQEVTMAMRARGFDSDRGAASRRRAALAAGPADWLWLGFCFFVFFISVGAQADG